LEPGVVAADGHFLFRLSGFRRQLFIKQPDLIFWQGVALLIAFGPRGHVPSTRLNLNLTQKTSTFF
jgi:hypothetical protein